MALRESGIRLVVKDFQAYKRQLQEINKLNKQAFGKMNTGGVTSGVKQAEQAIRKVGQSTITAGKQTLGFNQSLSGLVAVTGGTVAGIVAVIGAIQGFIDGISRAIASAREFAAQSIEIAQAQEGLKISFDEVAKNAGYNSKQQDYALAQLKELGVGTTAAEKSLMRMSRANISWEEASKLATIAQGSASLAGISSSEAFERLVTGIQKLDAEYLDELGIQIKRTDAYKKFAKQQGLNASNLTTQQQQQALLNEIYDQSADVLNVYAKSSDTVGKAQSDLNTLTEDTKLAYGEALLPLKKLSIAIKTKFYEGLLKASASVKPFIDLLFLIGKTVVETLKPAYEAFLGFAGVGSIMELIGKAVFESTKFIMNNIIAVTVQVRGLASLVSQVKRALTSSDFDLADISITETFSQELERTKQQFQTKIPALFGTWDDLMAQFNVSSKKVDLSPSFKKTEEAIDDNDEATKALIKTYEKLDDIQRKFNEELAKTRKEADQKVLAFGDESTKKYYEMVQKQADESRKFEQERSTERSKLISDYNKDRIRQEKEANRKLEQERRRFELTQLQNKRQFQVQDKRLRAEGDILALMDLRENYELQKQSDKENFDLGQQQAKEDAKAQSSIDKEKFQDQLREFDAQTEQQRQKMSESYAQELEQFRTSRAEQFEELKRDLAAKEQEVYDSRNREIEELGRSLAQEKDLTKEGMEGIAEEIRKVFGEGAAGDALIKGWTSRTESAFGQLADKLKGSIAEINASVATIGQQAIAPSLSYRRSSGYKGPKPIGMRHGGEGVVTGPAHFYVEPGVREHFSFNPLNQGGNSSHNVSGGMTLKVDSNNQNLGAAVEAALADKAANLVLGEINIAIDRLKRR